MRLTVVGCAGSFPGPDSPASSYLVEHEGHRLVLDLGSGALGPLQRYTGLDQVDAVLLSHLHSDHCLDLTAYDVVRGHYQRTALQVLPVLGPAGTQQRLARAAAAGEQVGGRSTLTFRDHVPVTEIGPFRIATTRVEHPVTAYAIRVEAGGRALVYSGDTGPAPALVELTRGADLALFEATWYDTDAQPPGLHLSAAQAAIHAHESGVGRLLLTHLVPGRDPERSRQEAAAHYSGELSLAAAGASYEV